MNFWICRQIEPSVVWLRLRLCRLVWSSSTSLESGIALVTIACGIQLARAGALFEEFPDAYAHLGAIAPEAAWASTMLMLGSALATSLLIGSRRGRRATLIMLVVMWWSVAGLFWVAIPTGMMPAICSVVAAMTTWSFARLGRSD